MLDTIILGATFRGCGIASSAPGKSLILEPSIITGSDFALVFNTGTQWSHTLQTEGAKQFQAELQQRKALNERGAAATAAFSPLLTAWCLKRGIDIRLSTTVIEQNGPAIKVMDVEGMREYSARRIINAMPRPELGKWLTALVSAQEGLAGGAGPFMLQPALIDGQYNLSFQIPDDATWSEARAMFHRAWDMRPASLKLASIMLVGTRFDYRNHPNPAMALDAGIIEGGAL